MKGVSIFLVLLFLAKSECKNCSEHEERFLLRDICAAKCTNVSRTCGMGDCVDNECVCYDYTKYENYGRGGVICGPYCLDGCIPAGGFCNAVGVCDCYFPNEYFDRKAKKCVVEPACNGSCTGKICNNGKCECIPETNLIDGKCVPHCNGKCDAAKGQICVEPGVCVCKNPKENLDYEGKCANVLYTTEAPTATSSTTTSTSTTTIESTSTTSFTTGSSTESTSTTPITTSSTTSSTTESTSTTPITTSSTTGSTSSTPITTSSTTPEYVTDDYVPDEENPDQSCDLCATLDSIKNVLLLLLKKLF